MISDDIVQSRSNAAQAAAFNIVPISGTFGASIRGCDLALDHSAALIAALKRALTKYKVLVFEPQPGVGAAELLALGKNFGLPETEHPNWPNVDGYPGVQRLTAIARPTIEDSWHTDGATRTKPQCVSLLQAIEVPDYGRDTMFADMEAAFENLSPAMQEFLEGKFALHSWGVQKPDTPPVEHPLVMVDPATGRKTLYANRMYTRSIVGLRRDESDHILRFLFDQVQFGEHQLRVSWKTRAIVMWDNLRTQHYLVRDRQVPRVMHRVLAL